MYNNATITYHNQRKSPIHMLLLCYSVSFYNDVIIYLFSHIKFYLHVLKNNDYKFSYHLTWKFYKNEKNVNFTKLLKITFQFLEAHTGGIPTSSIPMYKKFRQWHFAKISRSIYAVVGFGNTDKYYGLHIFYNMLGSMENHGKKICDDQ